MRLFNTRITDVNIDKVYLMELRFLRRQHNLYKSVFKNDVETTSTAVSMPVVQHHAGARDLINSRYTSQDVYSA